MNNDIRQIDLGTLPDKTFPKDDGKTYIYKRNNGHVYIYASGSEKHICCDDGKILNIPIFKDTDFIHFPDSKHLMLYVKDNILYSYDKDGTSKVLVPDSKPIIYTGHLENSEFDTLDKADGLYSTGHGMYVIFNNYDIDWDINYQEGDEYQYKVVGQYQFLFYSSGVQYRVINKVADGEIQTYPPFESTKPIELNWGLNEW